MRAEKSIQTRKRIRKPYIFKQALKYMLIILSILFFLFPIFWITVTAIKGPGEYYNFPPRWLPKNPTLIHFKSVQTTGAGGYTALKNSFIIATSSTVLVMLVGFFAAYSMARFKTGGNNLAFMILSQRFLPPIAIVFPLFLMMRVINFIDTYQVMILIYTVFNLSFVIWMLRGYFKEVPIEIEESAMVDGCSRVGVLFKVVLPMTLPGLITTAVFAYIFSWTEFLFAVIFSRTRVFTVPVAVSAYFGSEAQLWGEAGVMAVLSMLPIFFIGLAVQKHFARGLTLGSVKG
ncbi:MAG: carbohydrate ABC transporter permease [Spirochaetota bacterium]|nr:MAG: carbohydrate ABC transporter permease [Spirochaetota bacterium]